MRISIRKLQLICAGFVILWLNAGCFALVGEAIPAVVKFGVVAGWFGLALVCEKQFLLSYLKIGWPLLCMLGLMLVSHFSGISVYYSSYFMTYLYATVLTGLFIFYYNWGTYNELRTLLGVFMIDFLIKTVRTYGVLITNPELVRILSTGSEVLLQGALYKGIGAYDWCYQLSFVVLILLPYMERKHSITVRIMTGVIVSFLVITLFMAQITMAFLMIVMFVFSFYALRKGRSKGACVVRVLVGLLVIVAILNMNEIIELLINYADKHMAKRLENLWYAINTRDISTGDIGSRMKLYLMSWRYFVNSPLWGSWGDRTLGFHSSFLDLLGVYGILGVTGMLGMLYPLGFAYKRLAKNSQMRMPILLGLIGFTVLSIVNVSIWCGIFMVVNLILPLYAKYSEKT